MTILAAFDIRDNAASAPGWEPSNSFGVGQSITQNGITLTVDSAFSSFLGKSTVVDAAHHDVPEPVWKSGGVVTAGGGTALRISGLTPGLSGAIRFGGVVTNSGRHRLLTVGGNAYQHNNPGGTAPVIPEPPTDAPFTADGSGEVSFTLDAVSVNAVFDFIQVIDATEPGPTVEITGDLQPGASFTLNYSNYDAIPVSPVTITDSNNNSITVAVTINDTVTEGKHGGTATGTYPALPSSGTGTGLLFGNVTVELNT